MKLLKKLSLYAGRLLIACMFAICMVIGVVPIIPKRKEQFEIEVKLEKLIQQPKAAQLITRKTNKIAVD